MESSKVQAQLCYGTLLGAVREKDFLAHDDDVDIIIHTGAKSKEEAIAHRDNLIQVLHQRDYKTFGILPEKNFHVVVGGAQFDLFPCWTEGGQIFLLMEGLKYRSIQEDIILPSSQVELCGRTYPAPNNPAEFLAERYGDSWETPDPYHEWPWALQRD